MMSTAVLAFLVTVHGSFPRSNHQMYSSIPTSARIDLLLAERERLYDVYCSVPRPELHAVYKS